MFDNKDNIIDVIGSMLNNSTDFTVNGNPSVNRYLKTLREVLKSTNKKSFLNAEIINRKITNIMLKLPVNGTDNLDVVEFSNRGNPFTTNSFMELFEVYIRMNVYESTGIDYNTFKNMTVVEQEMMKVYLGFKLDVLNIDVVDIKQNDIDPFA